jgi:hypothetical protein
MNQNRPFDAMYFDSNILLANHWPDPLPELRNTFDLARWWKIATCIPAPVLEEVECHWHRELQESLATVRGSRGKLLKAARPIDLKVAETDVDFAQLQHSYDEMVTNAIKHFDIHVIDFTRRSAQEVFGYATRYKRPFAPKGEGKGFQDAVILLSVLDHLETHAEVSGVLITKDLDLANLNYRSFAPKFEPARLRVLDLKAAFEELFHPYFDETRVKPYRKLQAEAEQLARAEIGKLREFAASRLTPDMLHTSVGDRILQIVSVDSLDLRTVQVPFPDNDAVSEIDISIKVMGTCNVRVVTDLSALRSLFGGISVSTDPATREQEKKLSWFGLVEATGLVADGTLREITPRLLTADEV